MTFLKRISIILTIKYHFNYDFIWKHLIGVGLVISMIFFINNNSKSPYPPILWLSLYQVTLARGFPFVLGIYNAPYHLHLQRKDSKTQLLLASLKQKKVIYCKSLAGRFFMNKGSFSSLPSVAFHILHFLLFIIFNYIFTFYYNIL